MNWDPAPLPRLLESLALPRILVPCWAEFGGVVDYQLIVCDMQSEVNPMVRLAISGWQCQAGCQEEACYSLRSNGGEYVSLGVGLAADVDCVWSSSQMCAVWWDEEERGWGSGLSSLSHAMSWLRAAGQAGGI